MNFNKFEVYGNPTLQQGGWERTGEGNEYIKYMEPDAPNYTYRICTIDYVPQHHPNQITVTGIASKELEVSVLALRSDNYIISALGWQDNGYTFNLGSTYDKLGVMFRFKNGDAIAPNQVSFDIIGDWHDTPHYIHNTSTDTITTLPAVVYPNAATATVGAKGNTVQSGTPTPDNPIMPQGTGERTVNLYDYSTIVPGYTYDSNGQMILNPDADNRWRYAAVPFIEIEPGATYIRTYNLAPFGNTINFYDGNKNFLERATPGTGMPFTIPSNCNFVTYVIQTENMDVEKYMFTKGSTAPESYVPYGYKVPISSAGQTTPIYLGEVQTTRKVKKLVLSGEESCTRYDFQNTKGISISNMLDADYTRANGLCSHYPVSTGASLNSLWIGVNNKILYFVGILDALGISSATDFKTYLQQQYAADTPVTVWYVLSNEETGIVNEPLMRIGDYADSISNVSIPVTAGGDTLSVNTTVQPSEVTATYKGWHPTVVHERNNGAWTE